MGWNGVFFNRFFVFLLFILFSVVEILRRVRYFVSFRGIECYIFCFGEVYWLVRFCVLIIEREGILSAFFLFFLYWSIFKWNF